MKKKMSMTNKILIWMTAGLVVGSVINETLNEVDFIQNYLVNGLFHVTGAIFISLLKMLVVPLVTFSLICGVCGLGDVNKLGRVGLKSFLLFMLTTALAISLAIGIATMINPGHGFELTEEVIEFTPPDAPPLTQVIIDLVPSNPIAAYAEGNMLQIIFFTILFGICILMAGEAGRSITEAAEKLNAVMMQLVSIVMHIAPYGVFALMAKTFALQGLGLILPMISYFSVVVLVMLLHGAGTLMVLLKLFTRVNPITFFTKMREVQVFAFSTSSSNATIPVTLRTVEKRLGVDNSTASFVVLFAQRLTWTVRR